MLPEVTFPTGTCPSASFQLWMLPQGHLSSQLAPREGLTCLSCKTARKSEAQRGDDLPTATHTASKRESRRPAFLDWVCSFDWFSRSSSVLTLTLTPLGLVNVGTQHNLAEAGWAPLWASSSQLALPSPCPAKATCGSCLGSGQPVGGAPCPGVGIGGWTRTVSPCPPWQTSKSQPECVC